MATSTNSLLLIINDKVNQQPKYDTGISLDLVYETIFKYTGIGKVAILSRSRKKELTFCRYLVAYLLREYTTLSLSSIGELIKRDHSDVSYAVNVFRNEFGIKNKGQVTDSLDIIDLYNIVLKKLFENGKPTQKIKAAPRKIQD